MQRVAIARALVNEPRLILADEPTGNLDQRNAHEILELLRQQATGDRAVVMVTHDHELAERYADEIVSLVDGRVADLTQAGPNGRRRGLMAGLASLIREMIGSVRSQARLTVLLTRHLLHVVKRQRARAFVLWAALTLALGIGVGLLAFVTSIEDSFRERGRAVGGVSDVQVEAIGASSLRGGAGPAAGADRGDAVRDPDRPAAGRPRSGQGAAGRHGDRRRPLGAAAAQRRAERPQGPDRRLEQAGAGAADRRWPASSRVRRGERVRIFAFERAPRVRVARVVDVDPAIEDVITLPRDRLESLRGAPGQPTVVYVKLAPGTSTEAWERRAERVLPDNAVLTTPAVNQGELSHVLDFTVRAPTFVFGMVVLAIAGLLIYVLQLMRMLERQEDLGLLRALGSRRLPLILAESIVLTGLLAAAIAPGVLIGTPIARLPGLAGADLPDRRLRLQHAGRGPPRRRRGRRRDGARRRDRRDRRSARLGPRLDRRAARPLPAGGGDGHLDDLAALGAGAAGRRGRLPGAWGCCSPTPASIPAAAVTILVGLALATPGVVGLVAIALGRREHGGSKVTLVARGAVEANPRRAALAAAIMALGVAAVVPPQLAEHSLVERTRAAQQVDPPRRPAAAGRRRRLRQRSDRDPLRPAGAARRDDRRPADGVRLRPLRGPKDRGARPSCRAPAAASSARGRPGCPAELPILREHPDDILISRVMAAGLDLDTGEDDRAAHRGRAAEAADPRRRSRTSPGPRAPST